MKRRLPPHGRIAVVCLKLTVLLAGGRILGLGDPNDERSAVQIEPTGNRQGG